MGGSRGGSYFSGDTSPTELRRQVLDAEAKAQDAAFESRAASHLNSVLTDLNSRNTTALEQHLREIKAALERDIDGTIDLRFGGSVAKHTFVDGLSDADSLVLLNKSELKGFSPAQVRAYFAQRLRERFPQTEVVEGKLAVTLKFADIDVQLIPALRQGNNALRISEASGGAWSATIRPDRFAAKLTSLNQQMSGKLIPTIKLAKAIQYQLPEQQQLSGYHVESLAIAIFETYQGPQATKPMLRHFFIAAPHLVRQPIRDSTGQSIHVDEYLGKAGSLERRIVADALGRIGRSIVNADTAKSIDQWESLLE